MWDSHVDEAGVKLIATSIRGNLILSIANALSSLIHILRRNLDTYHADVVLSLGIMLYGPMMFTQSVPTKHKSANTEVVDTIISSLSLLSLMVITRLMNAIIILCAIVVHLKRAAQISECELRLGRSLSLLGSLPTIYLAIALFGHIVDLTVALRRLRSNYLRGQLDGGEHLVIFSAGKLRLTTIHLQRTSGRGSFQQRSEKLLG
jgi:hypothetical protein